MAEAKHFCPLCRGAHRDRDAVRAHLIVEHKRAADTADELLARFDTAQAIPEAEREEMTIWGVPMRFPVP